MAKLNTADQKPTKTGEKGPKSGEREERIKEIRNNLLKRRNEILNEAKEQISKAIRGDTRQLVETALDEGDLAEINIQEGINLQRLSIYRDTLRDIDEALRKINEGTYGICEECGQEIGQNRLTVMPTTRFCVSCQEKREQFEKIETGVEESLKY